MGSNNIVNIHNSQTPAQSPSPDGDDAEAFEPWTAEQAQAWRQRSPQPSPWAVVCAQAAVSVLATVVVWLVWGGNAGLSIAYGAFCVVASTAVLARGVSRKANTPAAALVALFGWEMVKIALCVALLALTPQVLAQPQWLAVLAGVVLALKSYWLAFLSRGKRVLQKTN